MIQKNIEIAKQLLNPIEEFCKICGVMGSSIYKNEGDVDIDIFIVIDRQKFNFIHNYFSPIAKSKSNDKIAQFFKVGKVNFNSYYILYKDKEIDLIVMCEDLFENITTKLFDHYAITLKQKVAKISKKKFFLFGIDGSKIENTYSSHEEKTELVKFPINLTINEVYYSFLPLSNILGDTIIFQGKRRYEKSKNNLICMLNKEFEDNPSFSWKNLIV